jgi:hypothetical protein
MRTVREFIKTYKEELIRHIKAECPTCGTTYDVIEDWISNDEDLYRWALSSGVKNI